MESTSRRRFMASEKVAAIRRHLIENAAISDLCDEISVKPTQYYSWQKQLFENGERAFQRCNGNAPYSSRQLEQQIAKLKEQLAMRSEATVVLLQDYVDLRATAQ